MRTLTIRASADLLARLEALRVARGLADRSAAVRLAVREAATIPQDRASVPDRDELLRLLGEAARDGSVTAMKTLLAEHRGDGQPGSTGSLIGDLAARRQQV